MCTDAAIEMAVGLCHAHAGDAALGELLVLAASRLVTGVALLASRHSGREGGAIASLLICDRTSIAGNSR
jgi:hypothetical protein